MRKIVVSTLAAMIIGGAFQASAMAEEITVAVSYADLDLKTVAGRDKLKIRIEAAVKTVCARPSTRDIKAMQAWDLCRASASKGAMHQADRTIEIASM